MARPHCAEGGFTLWDLWNKRARCSTLILFLMPREVRVLWLVPLCWGLVYTVRLMEKESWLLDFDCLPNACDVSILWLVLMVLRVGLHCEIDGKRELVAWLWLSSWCLLMLVFCNSSHWCWGLVWDWWKKRACCLTLIVFLMPFDVSVLWLVPIGAEGLNPLWDDGKIELVAWL